MEKWYRRLADVPGVDYPGSPGVDRTRLPGHNTEPKVSTYTFEGKRSTSLMWPMKDGETGSSPANTWESKPRPGESPSQTALRQTREKLELPGTLSDYHFIIQGCHQELKASAADGLWAFGEIEALCLLDIRLISRYPNTVGFEREGEVKYYGIVAFFTLLDMYQREGMLREALDVARVAERFGQAPGKVQEIEERIARIEAEADAV